MRPYQANFRSMRGTSILVSSSFSLAQRPTYLLDRYVVRFAAFHMCDESEGSALDDGDIIVLHQIHFIFPVVDYDYVEQSIF